MDRGLSRYGFASPWSCLRSSQTLSSFHLERPLIIPYRLGFLKYISCLVAKKTLPASHKQLHFVSQEFQRERPKEIIHAARLLLLQGKPERAPDCHAGCLGTELLPRSAHVLGDTSVTWPSCFSLPPEWPACVTALRQRRQLPPEHFTTTVELLCTVSDH